jgi:hypothetical protein
MRRIALLLIVVAMFAACRKSAPPAKAKESEAQSSPAAPTIHHRRFGSGVSPAITKLDPDTVAIRDGHISAQHYSLEYDILGIEKVQHAEIVVYAPGAGRVQSFEISPSAHATVEFILDNPEFDLGPTVRLRARCPLGSTDWFTLGTLPMEYTQRGQNVFRVANVSPPYIERYSGEGEPPAGVGVNVTLWGPQLGRDCTPEAEVNGSTVEAHNVYAVDKQVHLLILRSDLQNRPVAARYLEIELQLSGPGVAVADIAHLNLREL